MIHVKLSMPKFCLLIWSFSSFFKEFRKIIRGFVACFGNLTHEKSMKFCKFLDAAWSFFQVTETYQIFRALQ